MASNEKKGLFENYRQCALCGRRLAHSYEDDYCPACQEFKLLREVKDYIRANDVNEYQVAEHFQIPLKQVKEWIREGRIEYRQNPEQGTISGMHCLRCGAPVTFGTLCPKCLKLLNGNIKGYEGKQSKAEDDRMRFLDNNTNRDNFS